MKLELVRVAGLARGTLGVLLGPDGYPLCVTLEDPWRENQANVSCIPAGEYRCLRCKKSPDYGYADSPKFGDTFQVFAVPGRSTILIHWGNTPEDTRGCVLLGKQFGRLGDVPAVQHSRTAFAEFRAITATVDEFALRVREAY